MEENNIDEEGVRFSCQRNNVRRKLFQDDKDDPCDKEKRKEQILEEVRRQSEQSKLRWNFDFEKEIPLPGRYEWVKVEAEETSDTTPNSVLRDSTNIPQGQAKEDDLRNVIETE
ncbi:uncharacterized protein LOC109857228 isoform X2 [Pseudomyrmex gracilis]|nr:uncharacterized protein LOC109857228 isoform X2 [Pseudomyrmex gracilis]XP_020289157.1 uncharacterized protein LOC109857228 isoform X2 [Pseudomyrmex gracilis]XP_020289247.1 uncharacterized protein LOC109857228 isoform X2 [Pseudomyrmex gracilis]